MKRKHIILLHLLVWALLLVSNVWQALSANVFSTGKIEPVTTPLFVKYLTISAVYLLIPLSCFYSAYMFVAPQLFARKRYFKAIAFTLFTLIFVVTLRYLSEYHLFLPVFGFDNYNGHVWPVSRYVTNIFFYYFPSYFVYGLMYFFAEGWYKNRHRHQELEKEKATAELAFLRSQVNPHFLFNSINDIYSLTYQKSEQAPAALLKLSEILRYMLREDSNSLIPLSDEIAYLENVIDLQRISSKDSAFISFKLDGRLNGQKVPSLIFIPFVENAFKHGVLTDPGHPVEISLSATDLDVRFSVFNKKNSHQKDITGGIGLNNIKRRLELLYPGSHELTIDDKNDSYNLNLRLQL